MNISELEKAISKQVQLLGELCRSAVEQREALKSRDLENFRHATSALSEGLYHLRISRDKVQNELSAYQNSLALLERISLPDVAEYLSDNKKDHYLDLVNRLVQVAEEFKTINEGNLTIILGSLRLFKIVADMSNRPNQVYQPQGELAGGVANSVTFDKSV